MHEVRKSTNSGGHKCNGQKLIPTSLEIPLECQLTDPPKVQPVPPPHNIHVLTSSSEKVHDIRPVHRACSSVKEALCVSLTTKSTPTRIVIVDFHGV
jgi:hypothetical protein